MSDWSVSPEEYKQIVFELEVEMAYPPGVTDNDPHFDLPSGEDRERCYLCHKYERHAYGDSFAVNQCDRCEEYVCQNCAEVDYDMVGDPPHYVNTQWICDSLKGGCRSVDSMLREIG